MIALPRTAFLGIGIASDLHEPGLPEFLNARFERGDVGYYEFYIYRENGRESAEAIRKRLDPRIPLVWHCGGEFELPLHGRVFEDHRAYIGDVIAAWRPQWCLEDVCAVTLGGTRPIPGRHIGHVPPPITAATADLVAQNVIAAQALCDVPFVPEVPYFNIPVPHDTTLSAFFERVCRKADCDVVFDVGHYMSWNMIHGRPHDADLDAFPWERVCEIHLGGGYVGDARGRIWVDDHTAPVHPAEVDVLRRIIGRCVNLRGVLLELIGCDFRLVDHSLRQVAPVVGAAAARLAS